MKIHRLCTILSMEKNLMHYEILFRCMLQIQIKIFREVRSRDVYSTILTEFQSLFHLSVFIFGGHNFSSIGLVID